MLEGDASKARQVLGWTPEVDFRGLVTMMVEHDLELARREKFAENLRFRNPKDVDSDFGFVRISSFRPRHGWIATIDPPVLVACPDARPPAYQAVVGMSRSGVLGSFVTSFYYDPRGAVAGLVRRIAPRQFRRIERVLLRRHDPEIPSARVQSIPSFDLALRLEGLAVRKNPRLKRCAGAMAHWRFDAAVAGVVRSERPDALLVFSDVGSELTLPLCKKLGIPTILSMVHGDVREEAEVLAAEAAAAPDFLPIYLGDGMLDREELAWLHQRRLQDIALADHIVVPSEHIEGALARHGLPRARSR